MHVMTVSFLIGLIFAILSCSGKFSREQKMMAETFFRNMGFDISSDNFSKVKHLNLEGLPIYDHDLHHLALLRNLEELSLFDTRINGYSLSELCSLKKLQVLVLSRTYVSDASFKSLICLKDRLSMLGLSETLITNYTGELLEKFSKLRNLDLSGNYYVTGVVFNYVANMPALKDLDIQFTPISITKIEEFLQSYPHGPRIHYSRHKYYSVPKGRRGLKYIHPAPKAHSSHRKYSKIQIKKIPRASYQGRDAYVQERDHYREPPTRIVRERKRQQQPKPSKQNVRKQMRIKIEQGHVVPKTNSFNRDEREDNPKRNYIVIYEDKE